MINTANLADRLIERATRAGVPGATLGIWSGGQETLVAHGVLNCATEVPVTPDSLFQVGSITKIWTATMIMQLIDEGRLSLDTTVAQALPGVRLGTEDVGDRVMMRHLLTHTSGIDGDIFTDTGRGNECVQRYVALLAEAPSVFAPGAAYSYCNSGYVLLGRIIEVLDGRTWDESLRERLTGPLAITRTVTLPEEALLHRAAVGHRHGDPVDVWGLPRSVGPAGLITATASDLLTFARLHLDGGVAADGKRLLSEASVAAMQSACTAIPEFSAPGSAIGLGWRLSRWGDRTMIGHDGDTIGQSAYLRIDPEAGVAACLLTNATESETLYRDLFNEVFGTLTGVSMPGSPRPAGVPGAGPAARGVAGMDGASGAASGAADLERYAGHYERVSRRFDVTVRDGRLTMKLTMTGNLATLVGSEPEELLLFPAESSDSSGTGFVVRSRDDEPWAPVSFGQFGDGAPYLYMSGRVAPRVA